MARATVQAIVVALPAISVVAFAAGCGGGGCPTDSAAVPGSPRVLALDLPPAEIQQAYRQQQQLGPDPWLVVLALDFEDAEGDLGFGRARLYLRGELAYEAELEPLFRQRPVALDARAGTLGLPVRVDPDPDLLAAGGRLELPIGVALVDAAGHAGQCAGLDVRLDYRPAD